MFPTNTIFFVVDQLIGQVQQIRIACDFNPPFAKIFIFWELMRLIAASWLAVYHRAPLFINRSSSRFHILTKNSDVSPISVVWFHSFTAPNALNLQINIHLHVFTQTTQLGRGGQRDKIADLNRDFVPVVARNPNHQWIMGGIVQNLKTITSFGAYIIKCDGSVMSVQYFLTKKPDELSLLRRERCNRDVSSSFGYLKTDGCRR